MEHELRKMPTKLFIKRNISTKEDRIPGDICPFPISYAEMKVLGLDRVDYFHFNILRNCLCRHMSDRSSLLDVFCGDILQKLHVLASRSMFHCVMFVAECLNLINADILDIDTSFEHV